jgi:hypothetical protein
MKKKSKKSNKSVDKELFSTTSVKNGKYFISLYMYIYLIISILFYSGIIYYIYKVKDCSCFIELNKNENVNIEYIYIIEIILLSLFVILFLLYILFNYIINNLQKGGANNIIYYILFMYVISLIVYGYLIYNIYKFSQIPDDNCNCMKSWLKFLLYTQCVFLICGLIFQSVNIVKLASI